MQILCHLYQFESDVISDGTQTILLLRHPALMFESDVISDGTQTLTEEIEAEPKFESDVISDGTQTSTLFILLQM